jgi:hypothetical protein
VGLQHIQVGRFREVESLKNDIERIADGGAAFRLVIGDYGSGKTFFLSLVRAMSLEKKLVVAGADLNPDRRLHASAGQARSLYAELMHNLATRAKPDGGALASIVERFISSAAEDAKEQGSSPSEVIEARLAKLREMVGGYDFATVIHAYWEGHEHDEKHKMDASLRWLRGEYTTKTDARAALGVRTFIDDDNIYDHLKLMALFVRLAGFGGMFVLLDELVNLYKLGSSTARKSNYEQILRILNDSLQGTSEGLGFLLGGTPEFLMDPRRGLFSYQALASRLEENRFAGQGIQDFQGPVIRLSSLDQADIQVLLEKLRLVFAGGDPGAVLVPDEALHAFREHCFSQIGDAYFRTPRETIRTFLDLLFGLSQNPQFTWQDLLQTAKVARDTGQESLDMDDDDFADLRL